MLHVHSLNQYISCPYFFSNGASRSVGFVDLTTSSSSASTIVPYQERPYIDVESYSSRHSDSSRVVGDASQKGPLCELGVFYGARFISVFVPSSATVAQVRSLSLNVYMCMSSVCTYSVCKCRPTMKLEVACSTCSTVLV